LQKFEILNKLKEEFLNQIKLLYIFKDNSKAINVLIVINDDKVFALGKNGCGVLGFGDSNEVNELKINEEISHKQIKNTPFHVIA
jgi:hypothetical protein